MRTYAGADILLENFLFILVYLNLRVNISPLT